MIHCNDSSDNLGAVILTVKFITGKIYTHRKQPNEEMKRVALERVSHGNLTLSYVSKIILNGRVLRVS